MPSLSRMPRGAGTLGRRGLVLGAVGSGVLALAGCGIHLEDDAPHVPLVPRRTPIGAETLLLDLLRNSRELAAACATWTTGAQVAQAPSLAAIHARQADVLAALLGDAHVPADLVARATPTPSTTPTTATATPTTTATPTPTTSADIAELERGPLAAATGLSAAPAPLLPIVAAILAQRYAAADLVGGSTPVLGAATTVGTAASAGPSAGTPTTAGTPPDPGSWTQKDLLSILAATRSATYGFEVVAAQGDTVGRALGLRTLATLAALQSAQEAALTSPAPPADLGYQLPFRVTTPALARKLAGRVATGLRAAYGSTLAATAEGADPFLDLVEWLGRVEAVVHDWGGVFVPFPGMTTP